MLIPLPNITYNIQEAIDYYEILKKDHVDLIWTKQEIVANAKIDKVREEDMIESFFNTAGRVEPFISWSREKILEIIEKKRWDYIGKVQAWNINVVNEAMHPKITRQTELQFGFAKKLMEMFPDNSMLQLVVNPVGTKYYRHSDTSEVIRVIIPLVSDEGAVWHFDDIKNVTHLPGHAYIVLTEYPHATDVFGPQDRISFMFLLPKDKLDWIKNYKCHI